MRRFRSIFLSATVGAAAVAGCDDGATPSQDKSAAKGGGPADDASKATDKPANAGEPDADAAALDSLDARVTRVAQLAAQIEAKPEDADKILKAAELDREALDALIFEIGADPGLSKQYQLALAGE